MNLAFDKFTTDESQSNPAVVAQRYSECPIDSICFYMAIGFGSVMDECPYLKAGKETADCVYGEEKDETGTA